MSQRIAESTSVASRQTSVRLLTAAFLVGAIIRLLLLFYTTGLEPKIADEKQYLQLASSILHGHGFAWSTGEATSLRPPLYPALVAGIWTVAGEGNLQAVRLAQFVIALLTAWLTYLLGRRAFDERTGTIAAAAVWLYPSLVFLNFNILTETLFTCLLVAFVLLAVRLVDSPRYATALACGAALGLAALARSVLWPVPIVLCPLLFLLLRGKHQRALVLSALVFAGYAVVIGPWAIRNTRLQHTFTVVDTMGGMNLRMGNYEFTPEDRMWDAVSLTGEKNWVYALTQDPTVVLEPAGVFTEGMKDKWAQRKAVEYIRAHPQTTARRDAIKFADFWGLEREFVAAVQQGLYAPPMWFAIVAALLMVSCYAAVALLGAAGIWLAPPSRWRVHVLLLLPLVVVTGVHTIVYGHSRYHLPLIPILALYAASVLNWRPSQVPSWWRIATVGATACVALLIGIWGRQMLVDGERLRLLIGRLL
jgi:4-amino-4-deoxy-L-arabinose transferase-like glycosyltransferase